MNERSKVGANASSGNHAETQARRSGAGEEADAEAETEAEAGAAAEAAAETAADTGAGTDAGTGTAGVAGTDAETGAEAVIRGSGSLPVFHRKARGAAIIRVTAAMIGRVRRRGSWACAGAGSGSGSGSGSGRGMEIGAEDALATGGGLDITRGGLVAPDAEGGRADPVIPEGITDRSTSVG